MQFLYKKISFYFEHIKNNKIKYLYFVFPLLVFFLSSLISVIFYGLRVDGDVFSGHLLPLDLLQDNLISSIFYGHSVLPLFNILLGITLKINHFVLNDFLPPQYTIFPLQFLIALLIILFISLSLYKISKNTLISMISGIFFAINPFFIRLTFSARPNLLEILLLLILFYSLISMREKYVYIPFLLLTLLILERATFQWFLLIPLLLFVYLKLRQIKKPLKSFIIFLCIILLFFIKNLILFNTFNLTTSGGLFFLQRMTWNHPELIEQNINIISEITNDYYNNVELSDNYHKDLSLFLEESSIPQKFLHVPILSRSNFIKEGHPVHKRHNKSVSDNYNYYPLIELHKNLEKDGKKLMKLYPLLLFDNFVPAFNNFFLPSIDFYDRSGIKYSLYVPPAITFLYRNIFYANFINIPLSESFSRYQQLNPNVLANVSVFGKLEIRLMTLVFFIVIFLGLKNIKKLNHYFISSFLFLYVLSISLIMGKWENMKYKAPLEPFLYIYLFLFIHILLVKIFKNRKKILYYYNYFDNQHNIK